MSGRKESVGTIYAIATIGARTERGCHVTRVSSRRSVCGLHIALVGDIVAVPASFVVEICQETA